MRVLPKITSLLFFMIGFLCESYSAEDLAEKPKVFRQKKILKKKLEPADTSIEEKLLIKKRPRDESSKDIYFNEENVLLERGKGGKETGGGKGGFFWRVNAGGKRAGKVFINWIDEEPLGEHASIQIFLNKQSQGKHIGRFTYSKACTESSYDEVYAHMRKNNIASRKAAEAAGFKVVTMEGITQLLLKWARKGK